MDEACNVAHLLEAYQWLVCYLLTITDQKVTSMLKSGEDAFAARNKSQVFYARTLSIAFIEVRKKLSYPKFKF